MFWLSLLLKVFTGNLAGLVGKITGYLGKLSDNETAKITTAMGVDKEVAIAQLETSAKIYHDRKDLFKGMWITQWLIGAALIPPLVHSGMVYLDSTPFFYFGWTKHGYHWLHHIQNSWHVVKLPKPYDMYEWSLISSLVGIQAATTAGLGLARALIRR